MPYISTDTPAQTGPRPTTPLFRIHMGKSLIFLPVTSLFQSCFLSAATTATGAPDCTGNAAGMPRELHGLYAGVSRERCKLCNTPPLPATNSAVFPQTASYGPAVFRSLFAVRPGTSPQFSQSARSLFAVRPATNSGTRPRGQRRTETLQIDAPRSPLLDSPQATASLETLIT